MDGVNGVDDGVADLFSSDVGVDGIVDEDVKFGDGISTTLFSTLV